MATWFTSDTHFSHGLFIRQQLRPFETVEAMDEALVERWNQRVHRADTIWFLGDFCWRNTDKANHFLNRLNGHKHLIWGNHDSPAVRKLANWTSSQPYAEIKLDGQNIVLFHYALRVWNKAHYGALHFYGHSHGHLPGDSQSCDVGVDAWDYQPVNLDEIKARLSTSPTRQWLDHHQPDRHLPG